MAFLKLGSTLQILQPNQGLYKTASKELDNVVAEKNDNFTYFQTIALHSDVPNLNGDIFPLDELKKSYKSFIGRGLYLDHNAQSVANAVGKVFDAKLIEIPGATDEEGKYGVVCLCGVDKTTHPDIAKKVASGVIDSVSMGASVGSCTCGICGVKCSTPEEFCVHLQHQGQVDPDTGKKCTSINHDVSFTELSLVGVPADPYAKMQQVFADFVGGMTKIAGEEKQFLEKFSFSIPCGNEKLCEMIYNLLDGYKKQGIMDLSADGSILKLSVEAKSEAEALKKLESISQEQGLDVEKPLKKEENLMPNEDIKPVEEQVEKTAGEHSSLEGWELDEGNDYYLIYKKKDQNVYKIWDIDANDWYDSQEIDNISAAEKMIENLAEGLPSRSNDDEEDTEEPTVSDETIKKYKERGFVEKGTPEYDEFYNAGFTLKKSLIPGEDGKELYNVIEIERESSKEKNIEKKADSEEENLDSFDYLYSQLVNGNITEYKQGVNKLFQEGPVKVMEYMDWMEEHGIDPKEALKVMKNASETTDFKDVQSSNTQSNEVKDVKAEEKKEEVKQEKTAAMVPPFTDTKAPAAPVADPIVAPVKEPEAKPEIPAPAPEVKPLKDAPLADAPMGDKPMGDKPMADKPAVPPMADGKEKFEEVKPEAPAKEIKTKDDAVKALEEVVKAGDKADLKALEEVLNFLKADKKETPAKEEKKDDKKEDKKEDAPKADDKKDDKESAKDDKKEDKPAEEKKAEAEPAQEVVAEPTTEEIPVEAKKEEKEEVKEVEAKAETKDEEKKEAKCEAEVKPTFANVSRVSLLKTANLLDSKWVFHLKGTNKVACLSIKNLLPGVAEKVAYLTSKEFYNEMMSTLEKHAELNEGAVKEITANFNEKVKVDSDEKKSQIAKATNKVKVETDAKKVSDTASKVTESLTDDGKAQKQDKVNSKEDAGAIESASKKAPAETDIKVDAAMESKLKQVTAALEAKEAELNQLKLQQALEAKTAKARNIVSMSIKAGLVKCNEQFRQEELLKQASPVKAKEEAMKRTADAMVKDLLGMSDEELDRQASYLSNFKVEAEVKQLKPIKIEASYNESNEANIIEALAAQMM